MMNAGILHPGEMGVSIAASAKNSGYTVFWSSQGRSLATRQRAEEQGFIDTGNLANLCRQSNIIISVCPPHAAETVLEEVIGEGYRGLYLEANAVSPTRVKHMEQSCQGKGIQLVDGSIIGGPAWKPGATVLYLSGEQATYAAEVFNAGPLATKVMDGPVGMASALKMCYASYTKGSTALLCASIALAEGLGVLEALQEQWKREGSGMDTMAAQRATRVTAKAWRFTGEMDEIAATYASIGLPDGFHLAAAEIYRRMAQFKDADETPTIDEVLQALLVQSFDTAEN
jgi:3-hydroxyisobutyrate dehydrogenase-like beta-hydroxyacid dehydrogenase